MKVGHRLRFDLILERRVRPLAQENLAGLRLVAQACSEVRDAAEDAVVVASLVADPTEGRVSDGDAGAEAELVAALAPALGEAPDSVADREGEPRGLLALH